MRVRPRSPRSLAVALLALMAAAALLAGCAGETPALGTTAPTAPGSVSPGEAPSAIPSAIPSDSSTTQPTPASGSGVARLPGEPNPTLTPGAINPAVTQATIGKTICVSGWTATVRPPSSYTADLKGQQVVAYGYTDHVLADYEEDHLISLEIGGAPRDPRNLWPEPYTVKLSDGRSVGARVKDLIENRLHDLVCAGQISLAVAQNEIATDWISAWFELDGETPPTGGGGATATLPPTLPPTPTTVPASGTIKVTISSITSPVSRGASATLVARTSAGASCSIIVRYKSGPSKAQGLGPKTASGAGSVSWTWTIGSRTTLGSWPVTVNCSAGGKSASAGGNLVVR